MEMGVRITRPSAPKFGSNAQRHWYYIENGILISFSKSIGTVDTAKGFNLQDVEADDWVIQLDPKINELPSQFTSWIQFCLHFESFRKEVLREYGQQFTGPLFRSWNVDGVYHINELDHMKARALDELVAGVNAQQSIHVLREIKDMTPIEIPNILFDIANWYTEINNSIGIQKHDKDNR